MSLPKQIKNSQSGQILIIFLLILVVGLAIVLSIASRTVTDVRQTTTSDESNRAYFAAESGVENALKKIQENPSFTASFADDLAKVNLESVNRASAEVSVEDLRVTAPAVFEFPNSVAKDEVVQVSLINTFNTLTSSGTGNSLVRNDGLNVYWDAESTAVSPVPAIEVSIVSCSGGVNCASSPDFEIKKYTFDPASRANGFCPPTAGVLGISNYNKTTTTGINRSYHYKATVKFNTASCNNDVVTIGYNPVLARIRLLYNTTSVKLAVEATSSSSSWAEGQKDLPSQGSLITSVGSTPSGVNRKLTVTRLYPALPAIFDYVLYNGSSQPLSKP